MNTYQIKLRAALSPAERRIFQKLSTPKKIQDFLDSFPVNFSKKGEGIYSVRTALQKKRMHCMEGALVAAAALAFHGREPLLMDMQSTSYDQDHVIALFKENTMWGAISKTNHPVLRWRDPVYANPRELAMSYFNEYFWPDKDTNFKKKTMRAYSFPFNLQKFELERWVASDKDVDWLADALDASPHERCFPPKQKKYLRDADAIEIKAMKLSEWRKR
jgi:hypothetical protein